MDAAEELFATQGFTATSIKQIGAQANANPALLYYYFVDKAGLYHAVLERLGGTLRGAALPALGKARTAEDVVRAVVRAQVELVTRHPRAATLLLRELIDHNAEHAQPMILQLASGIFQPVAAAINRDKAAGQIRPGLDGAFATVSTIAQVVYFVLAQPMIRHLLAKGASTSPADLRRFGKHAEEFALAAIRVPRQPNRPPTRGAKR